MSMDVITSFFGQVKDWATNEKNILGVALVGSHARNAAKEYSDIDLMIIVNDPQLYLQDISWISQFGKVKEDGIKDEDWGLVKTKRVFYKNEIEAEFNFVTEEWSRVNPVDTGTKKVMTDGNIVLVDKKGLLEKLNKSI